MPTEIERKFLIDRPRCPLPEKGDSIRQGYISAGARATVRVRVIGSAAYLTLKGKTTGASRSEYEYPIPVAEAEEMLAELCSRPLVEKIRYRIPFAGHLWEVDIFYGDNRGLSIAEVELAAEDEVVQLPPWVTEEVTGDPRYYNASLQRNPYRNWADTQVD